MTEISTLLKEVLIEFDRNMKALSEHDVSKAIHALNKNGEIVDPPMEWIAEAMAFDFVENYQNNGWGTYYGPMFVLPNGDGTATESPSITRITEQIINYWTERSQNAKHPVLYTRYADVVWDFSRTVTGKPAHYTIAQRVVDKTIEIVNGNCDSLFVSVTRKLERALDIALSLNDNERVIKLSNAILAYEDLISVDSKLGLWGFAYDLLYDKEKIKLTDKQLQKIIGDLESHLNRASQTDDQWAVEHAAMPLAKHYRKIGQAKEVNS